MSKKMDVYKAMRKYDGAENVDIQKVKTRLLKIQVELDEINRLLAEAEGESSDRVTYSVVYEFEDGTSADINGEVYSSRGQAEMEARFGKFAYCMLGKRDEYRDSGCFDTKIVGWKVVQNDTDTVL